MAEWVDTQMKVTKIGDGKIHVEVGPEGFEWQLGELEEIAQGAQASEALKHNAAIAMRLLGVDFQNAVTLKTALELRTFKYPR